MTDQPSTSKQVSHVDIDQYETVQGCIQSLAHAAVCRDTSCSSVTCGKMKHVLDHAKNCEMRKTASCEVCKQLVGLCTYHAKNCVEEECHVPLCLSIRKIVGHCAEVTLSAWTTLTVDEI